MVVRDSARRRAPPASNTPPMALTLTLSRTMRSGRGIGKLRAEMNNNVLLLLIGGLWATMIGGFIALFVNS